MKTLYEILEISDKATQKEIRSAYHKLAKVWHPDKNDDLEATAQFQKIGVAYEILNDPYEKGAYDLSIKNNTTYHAQHPYGEYEEDTLSADNIKSSLHFCKALFHLSHEQRSAFFEVLKNKLATELVKSINDFNLVLRFLNNKERLAFFELMKAKLPSLFYKMGDSVNVYSYINIEEVKDSLPSLIPSLLDFYELMEYSTEEERVHVFEAMEKKLPALAIEEKHSSFRYIFTFLTKEQRTKAFETLKPELKRLIKSWDDVKNAAKYLDSQQFEIMLTIVKDNLIAELKGEIREFANKIERCKFRQEQLISITKIIKEDLKQLIKQTGHIRYYCNELPRILNKIDEPQKTLFLTDMFDSLPWMDVDKNCLEEAIFKAPFTSPLHRLMIFQEIKESLPQIIPIKEFDEFLTRFFPDPLDKHQARGIYFASLMDEFQEKINLSSLDECSLIHISDSEKRFNCFEEIESKLSGKNAIVATHKFWSDQLYFANQKTHKLTQIFINENNSSQTRQLLNKIKEPASMADVHELKIIKSLIGQIDVDDNDNDKIAWLKLHSTLQTAAQRFFSQEPDQGNCKSFEHTCKAALKVAREEVSNPNKWKNFFAILGLAVISFGIIPAGLAISAKKNTGSWQFRLFKAEHEKKIDELEAKVQQINTNDNSK